MTAPTPPRRGSPFRDVVGRIGARGFAALLQAITLVFLARLAGPAIFGEFVVAYTVCLVANGLLGIGSSVRALRLSAEDEHEGLSVALFTVRAAASIVVLTMGLLIVGIAAGGLGAAAGVIVASADGLAEYAQSALAGRGRHSASSIATVAQRLLPLAGLAIGSLLQRGYFVGYCLGAALAVVIVLVTSGMPLRPVRPHLSIVRTSRGYWFASMAAQLSQLEPWVVSLIASPTFVGNYGIAGRLIRPLTIVSGAMQSVMVPELSRIHGKTEFGLATRRLLRPILAYAVILIILSPWSGGVAVMILGAEYRASRNLVVAMVIAAALSAVAQGHQAVLLARARPAESALVVAVASTIGLVSVVIVGVTAGDAWLWVPPLAAQACAASGMWWRARMAAQEPSDERDL